jgi:hypothetical protein
MPHAPACTHPPGGCKGDGCPSRSAGCRQHKRGWRAASGVGTALAIEEQRSRGAARSSTEEHQREHVRTYLAAPCPTQCSLSGAVLLQTCYRLLLTCCSGDLRRSQESHALEHTDCCRGGDANDAGGGGACGVAYCTHSLACSLSWSALGESGVTLPHDVIDEYSTHAPECGDRSTVNCTHRGTP